MNALDVDGKGVAALRALDEDGSAERIDERRRTVEPGAIRGNGLVVGRLEEPAAGVPSFNLERFAGLHAEQRQVAPVEGEFAGIFTKDALHGDLA